MSNSHVLSCSQKLVLNASITAFWYTNTYDIIIHLVTFIEYNINNDYTKLHFSTIMLNSIFYNEFV